MADETVTINSINLRVDRAWRVVDFTPLYLEGTPRGDDFTVPGTAGETARARVTGAHRFLLPIYVFGFVRGETGAAATNPRLTLKQNIDYLRTNLLPPYSGGAKTVTITHTFEDSSTRTGSCAVLGLDLAPHDGRRGWTLAGALDIKIMSGALT